MESSGDMPSMSMANTKKEMLAVYQQMKDALETKDLELLDAEKERESFRKQAAQATAERAAAEDPFRRIQDLKTSIGRELTALAEQFDAETHEYERLKEAVAEKQGEIDRIYGVETAAADLAALIEAQRHKTAQFEVEMSSARAAWEKEEQDRAEQRQTERSALDRQRAWEKEEYEYALKRERAQQRNALEDEMAALEREIATKREAFDRQLAEQAHEVGEREASVAVREERIDELEAAVRAFPEELAAEVARAVEATRERLTSDFASREALLTKESEGERNVLTSRIEALQQLAERQAAQIDALTAQQERAYEKVQDIASKAIEGSRTHLVTAPSPTPRAEGGEG